MKKTVLSVAILATIAGSASAAFSLGDNAEVFLVGGLTARYDDNILLSDTGKTDDSIFEFDPGVEISIGKNAQLSGVLSFTEAITRYVDTTSLNTNLSIFSLDGKFSNGKTTVNFNAGYRQVNQNTPVSGVAGLLRRNEITLGASGEFQINLKSSLGLGADYVQTDYKTAGLADSKIFSVPLTYYFAANPKLDWSVGFRYRKTQLDAPGIDSSDYFYNVGVRVNPNQKLHGELSIGLNQRQPSVGKNESSIGLDSSATFDYSPTTKYTLSLNNDFGSASAGTTQSRFTLSGGVSTQLAADWIGSANLSYNITNYAGPRKDDYWTGSVGVTWILNRIFSMNAAYIYQNNSSNAAGSDYVDNVFAITASVKY